MEKTVSTPKTLIVLGAVGMAGSALIASPQGCVWVFFWLASVFALGFGIGMRGRHVHRA